MGQISGEIFPSSLSGVSVQRLYRMLQPHRLYLDRSEITYLKVPEGY